MKAAQVYEFITNLKAANQLGKVKFGIYGLEVEIIRPSWNGPQSSWRIFPNVELIGDCLVDRK